MNYTSALFFSLLPFAGIAQLGQSTNYVDAETIAFYSSAVKDTFTVSIQLPKEYNTSPDTRYPIVVLLDGDFYFPTMAPVMRQYEMTGLLPPMILVGIGYGSFHKMDSLRVRDFLYPESLETDEMTAPGGGKDFYQFLSRELLPNLESKLRVDTLQRSLLGHSFGGYFALYALLQQASEGRSVFSNIVAASPTLWYHDFYLNRLPDTLHTASRENPINIFMTAGDLENTEWTLNPIYRLTTSFKKQNSAQLYLNTVMFNFLDHMDTGQLSFIKGLQNFSQPRYMIAENR
ncbi:alpha/beta hydrolase [Parapedobacter tibetensis]|uniref:alpha/beta hydrolase n=1 Tax=Parapedobacter tibetensis TaxID=2972951 RepID=UPI00214DB54F|nr:alpha/beta hydrolase-fold protein [Parapedobacter tibetensis]